MQRYDNYCLESKKNIIFVIVIAILSVSIIIFSVYVSYCLNRLILVPIFIVLFAVYCILTLSFFIYKEIYIGFLIIFLPIIPLFQKLLPYKGRITFDIFDLSLELFFVFTLIILFLFKKGIYINSQYKNIFKNFNYLIMLWIIWNLFSVFFSINIYRSFLLFIIGVLGPAFVFYIITNKTKVNYNMLKIFLLSLLCSGIVALLVGFYIKFRYLFVFDKTADLIDLRAYGSNATIGIISFILPLIFIEKIGDDNKFIIKSMLMIFRILSILWIMIALSRWGYFVFFATVMLVLILDRSNSKKYYYFCIVVLIVVLSFVFFDTINELIIYRFTGSDVFKIEYIIGHTVESERWGIWENAFTYVKKNLLFGIGIGNHVLISPHEYTTAHNMFINILLERGILVWLTFIGIIIFFYRICFKFRKLSNNCQLKRISLMLSIGVTIFIIWTLNGGSLLQSTGNISALRSYYFFYILALQLYIIKLDTIGKENNKPKNYN